MKDNPQFAVSSSKAPTVWTIHDVMHWMTQRFQQIGFETPLLESQLILCKALTLSKVSLYIESKRPLTLGEKDEVKSMFRRRLSGEPLAYITQEKFWHDLTLFVDKRVLIPRPETELIIDFVFHYFEYHSKFQDMTFWDDEEKNDIDVDSIEKVDKEIKKLTPRIILDLCTGSGCLAIALAKRYPDALVIAVDLSDGALEVAKLNAEKHSVKIKFLHGDVTDQVFMQDLFQQTGVPDIITANPPYVSQSEWQMLDYEVKMFEPHLALVSNGDPIHIGKNLLQCLENTGLLGEQTLFCMEMAHGQPQLLKKEVSKVFSASVAISHLSCGSWGVMKDLDQKERFLVKVPERQERVNS